MCNFFSFVTQPSRSRDRYYFDWPMRQKEIAGDIDGSDSHSHICHYFDLNEDRCNKWEYDPITKALVLDMQNDPKNDRESVEKWVNELDFGLIVAPLVIKPIVYPLRMPKREQPSEEQIGWLKDWASAMDGVWASVMDSVGGSVMDSVGGSVMDSAMASVGGSVMDSVGGSVWASVGGSVMDSVGGSVWASVGGSVMDSVGGSVRAYVSSFFDVAFEYDFSSAVKLWESGLVPSFDGKTWRLHSGEDAKIVYEWMPARGQKERNDD